MRKFIVSLLAIITLAASVIVAPMPAAAQSPHMDPAERHGSYYGYHRGGGYYRDGAPHYRRYHEYRGRPHYRRSYHERHYYGRPYYRHRHRHRSNDAAIAAGVAGLAIGAIAGSALANQQPRYHGGGNHAYCASRYRSYDPSTGTYVGYDGRRRYCR